jgi:hypothetical protein
LVSDGESTWHLLADAYGTWLRRVSGGPSPASGDRRNRELTVAEDGTVGWSGRSARFAQLTGVTSFAADATTLAVTTATSHHVFLIGRRARTA